jgi:hypothetical protein
MPLFMPYDAAHLQPPSVVSEPNVFCLFLFFIFYDFFSCFVFYFFLNDFTSRKKYNLDREKKEKNIDINR